MIIPTLLAITRVASSQAVDPTSASNLTLYAYGRNITGLTVFYADGLAYIGTTPPSGASVTSNITFSTSDSTSETSTWNVTSTNSAFSITPSLYIVPTDRTFEQVGFYSINNSSLPTGAVTTGFVLFGNYLSYIASDGTMQQQFWAQATDIAGTWKLMWNAGGEGGVAADGFMITPVSIKVRAPLVMGNAAPSTSAARFENGTTIPLTKVRGSAEYTALMEQIIRRQTPDWLSVGGHWLSPFRALKRCLGLIPSHSYESTVLAEMISALKAASEITLQTQIEAVMVTAPWMLAWVSQIPDRHPDWVVNNALTLAGLEPWPTDHWFNEEFYLDTRYGLGMESQTTSSAQFWSELKENLLSLVKQHATRDEKYICLNPFTVLVAGEAANTREFLDVMHDIVRAIPGLCASKSKTPEWAKNGKIDQVEFIIPNDLTYGAAKGAAIWLRRRMDWTYCAELGIVDQYDMMRDSHAVEL
ncbi:hypothetical protein V494_04840 [Pseudogymnoascus sp. VKM F-4513 (FW-928)]|nr:hypothetical protein V494_04840 [Pseudogymnoascus sp. VKM F-4513 (FW-928)]